MIVTLRPYGRTALLAEYADLDEVLAAAAAARRVHGIDDVVPAARTVLARWSGTEPPGLRDALSDPPPATAASAASVTIPVVYDGDDLAAVASTIGVSVEEVVRRHCAPDYTAAFCGFAPGFAYLVGLDRLLHVARRATPRTRVPAGSVAIAAEFTAVYPVASPGGWQLLGRTETTVFSLERDPPALVAPGATVRFRPA